MRQSWNSQANRSRQGRLKECWHTRKMTYKSSSRNNSWNAPSITNCDIEQCESHLRIDFFFSTHPKWCSGRNIKFTGPSTQDYRGFSCLCADGEVQNPLSWNRWNAPRQFHWRLNAKLIAEDWRSLIRLEPHLGESVFKLSKVRREAPIYFISCGQTCWTAEDNCAAAFVFPERCAGTQLTVPQRSPSVICQWW